METGVLEEANHASVNVDDSCDESKDLNVASESAENFQKFIYELFDKNGILNDLRAYLRGHIVNVLRNVQNGSTSTCNRNFKQRLELPSQAINILVAEYLLCMGFNFSLSVFVSEIPLSNMVFDYAQQLLQNTYDENKTLRFKENDILSVLSHLGVKCDSTYLSNIIEMYENDKQAPLLMCMFKCMSVYRSKSMYRSDKLEDNKTVSSQSSETEPEVVSPKSRSPTRRACKHYAQCRTCQVKYDKLKDKLHKKKKVVSENVDNTNFSDKDMGSLMQKVNDTEGNLIDKMFDQMKSVYETEVEMVRSEKEKMVRMCYETQAIRLRQKQDEMEEAYRTRAEELELNMQEKKKFLWSLAQALREQHQTMSRAMQAVRCETQRLTAKEENLKAQLLETEEVLNRRGEDMRKQISKELIMLETHLESMKKERDFIQKEKTELEQLKAYHDSNMKVMNENNSRNFDQDVRMHYEALKNELGVVKKYIESVKLANSETKCVVERGVMTEELHEAKLGVGLNNEDVERSLNREEERVIKAPNQVVNDFKKFKNVNFCVENMDHNRPVLVQTSRSDAKAIEMAQLREENERLRILARQQTEQLATIRDRVFIQVDSRLQSSLHPDFYGQSLSMVCDSASGGAGAGEQVTRIPSIVVTTAEPATEGDARRHLINQWRALTHQKFSKIKTTVATPSVPLPRHQPQKERPKSAGARIDTQQHIQHEGGDDMAQPGISYQYTTSKSPQHPKTTANLEIKNRDKSPKSLLKEAKENLKTKGTTKTTFLLNKQNSREKSPSSVLREAKQRLRKLEIEAEAVEKSYLDFRKKQCQLRESISRVPLASEESIVTKDVGITEIRRSLSRQRPDPINIYSRKVFKKQDLDQYLIKKYETSLNMSERFKAKNATDIAKPIPGEYSHEDDIRKNTNLLEKPLSEFRKLYQIGTSHIRVIDNVVDKMPESVIALENLNKTITNDVKFAEPATEEQKPKVSDVENLSIVSTTNTTKPQSRVPEKLANNTNVSEKLANNTNISEELANNTKISEKLATNTNMSEKFTSGKLANNTNTSENFTNNVLSEKLTINTATNVQTKNFVQDSVPSVIQVMPNSDKNLLRIEVETISRNDIQESDQQDVLLVVQSAQSQIVKESESEPECEQINANMTILISPKRSIHAEHRAYDRPGSPAPRLGSPAPRLGSPAPRLGSPAPRLGSPTPRLGSPAPRLGSPAPRLGSPTPRLGSPAPRLGSPASRLGSPDTFKRSASPEQVARLTRNAVLDALFHEDVKENNYEIQEADVCDSISEVPKDLTEEYHEYQDDFSNCGSDNLTPISLPKASDDDSFWENWVVRL